MIYAVSSCTDIEYVACTVCKYIHVSCQSDSSLILSVLDILYEGECKQKPMVEVMKKNK